ncbi:hypothetical protein PENSPDRAFT_681826 [Peniophora sp. CONT]|nr:hypothetical protein PENSPDRAFT_681826 [Peniophora sp. CONT]
MPAISFTQTQAPSTPVIFSHWALYTILAIIVFVLVVLATVSNYRASRSRTRSRKTLPFWTMDPISATFAQRSPPSKLKPLLLGSSLSLPTSAHVRPIYKQEPTLVRGARMSRPSSFFSDAPVQPLLPIYTSRLHTPAPAPARPVSVRTPAPPASIGLDTPPPTPVIDLPPPPPTVEDLLRRRAEASNQFALPSWDSASSLYSDTSSAYSLTSILDAFPLPPASDKEVTVARPAEDLYPTPPPSPLVPIIEFATPMPPNVLPTPPAAAPLRPIICSSRSMDANYFDALVLDGLFASSHPSSSSLLDMEIFQEPECPPRQLFTAYKAPQVIVSPIPASTSFRASVECAAAGGYLTPPISHLWC